MTRTGVATTPASPVADPPRRYCETFHIPFCTPLLNVTLRTNIWEARQVQSRIAWALAAVSSGQRPPAPLQRARVTIERRSAGLPDHDGVVGGCKPLIDVLLVPVPLLPAKPGAKLRVRHKLGLSFLVDDGPAHLDLVVRAVRVPRREACTVITIEELAPEPPAPRDFKRKK